MAIQFPYFPKAYFVKVELFPLEGIISEFKVAIDVLKWLYPAIDLLSHFNMVFYDLVKG